MPPPAKQQVDAYVAGVNAFIATHHGSQLPPEFALLRFEPEPWEGSDVVVWVKMLAWDLSANYSLELLRHDLVTAVGVDRMRELMLPFPRAGLSVLPKGAITKVTESNREHLTSSRTMSVSTLNRSGGPKAAVATPSWADALVLSVSRGESVVRDILLGGATTESIGSNNWVVDGTLTESGRPLLANDPHLGARLPSTWYLAELSGGDFDVIGATLPGAPAVALGRNKFIAWGATNVAADVEDLYRERLDSSGRFAEFRGHQEPLTLIPETILVKGGPPLHLEVRVSRHGPLVSDAINANNAELRGRQPAVLEPLAFRWTALDPDDTTIAAFFKLNDAHNWADFTAALRDFVVPSQNFVYGDVDGHIGYYAPGRIPIRAAEDGSRPADGWTGDAEWIGWIPFDKLPHAADPPAHFLATANNPPAPPDYPFLLGLEWPEPYRAQRIVELLEAQTTKFNANDFARMQADTVSPHARALLPLLVPRVHAVGDSDRQAINLVRHWDADAKRDSAAAAIFEAWFLRLAPTIVGHQLGPHLIERYQERLSYVTRFIEHILTSPDSAWCADVTPGKKATCDDAVTTAFHEAVQDLTRRLGSDMTRWRWDAVHRAVFPHQLGAIALLRPLLNRSVPHGGDWSTLNVGPVATDAPYEQHTVPGYRQIIDLSPANDSRFIDAVGQSGHPLSPHYDDFLSDWQAVRYRKMRMDRAEIERGALGHLHLQPPSVASKVANSKGEGDGGVAHIAWSRMFDRVRLHP
jgi:penicillin amidase